MLPFGVVAPAAMWAAWRAQPTQVRARIGGYGLYVLLAAALFKQPLAGLVRHAAQYQLHSHTPLMPLVVAYLLYVSRESQSREYRTSPGGVALLLVVASTCVAIALQWRAGLSENDYLALMTVAFVSLLAAGAFLCFGARWMASVVFPFSLLLFMIPLPDRVTTTFETWSVLASADVSATFLKWTGMPLVRDGNVFALPGIVIEVAQECSGIRSSWVLLITSLIASHLLLKSPWRRLALVAFVIPLGILRNAFRILVIGLLCVHIGPHMIDSSLHRQGGPFFFVLSLIPFFLLVKWLRSREP